MLTALPQAGPAAELANDCRDIGDLLMEAKQLVSREGQRRAAALMLCEYASHRLSGGAEPLNGDAKFVTAIVALGSVCDTLSEALSR